VETYKKACNRSELVSYVGYRQVTYPITSAEQSTPYEREPSYCLFP